MIKSILIIMMLLFPGISSANQDEVELKFPDIHRTLEYNKYLKCGKDDCFSTPSDSGIETITINEDSVVVIKDADCGMVGEDWVCKRRGK